MTIEQIKEFSETATLELTTDWSFLLVNGTMIFFLIVLIGVVFRTIKQIWGKRNEKEVQLGINLCAVFIFVTSMLVMAIGYVSIRYHEKPAEGQELVYNAKQNQWIKEYIEPYFDNAPKEMFELEQVMYNYILEEKQKEKPEQETSRTPIKAITKNGKIIEGWAEIKPLAKGEFERIEYVHLEEELRFGKRENRIYLTDEKIYSAGVQNIVIHTNKMN